MPQITDDQRLMRDNARRMFAGADGLARTRRAAENWPHVDKAVWREFAAMGWLSLLLPEAKEGMGGSASDFVVLMEGLGDLLPPEPVGPALTTAPLLAACATQLAEDLLGALLRGDRIVLAATESPPPLLEAATHLIPSANWADVLIFGVDDGGEFTLRALELGQAGNALSILRTVDGSAIGAASLDAAPGHLLAKGQAIRDAFARCRNLQRLGAAAGLLGIAFETLQKTVDYLKLRRQFGVAIGSFQVLQHRAASLHVACHATRAVVHEAARAIGTTTEDLACAVAKAKAADTAMKVAKESVQLHGAIGFSDESDVAMFFRRAVTLAACYGSAEACYREAFTLSNSLHE